MSNTNSSEESEPSPAADHLLESTNTSETATDETFIHLTEGKYSIICALAKQPLLKSLFLQGEKGKTPKSKSTTTWKQLVTGTGRFFGFVILSNWLGLLRMGLISTGMSGAEELYLEMCTAYERALDDSIRKTSCHVISVFSPFFPVQPFFRTRLHFTHVGDERFRVELNEGSRYITKANLRVKPTFEEARRDIHRLASEASHINRCTLPGPPPRSLSKHFAEVIDQLPGNEPVNGAKFLENQELMSLQEEMTRTIAHVAKSMEEQGEEVPWDKLHFDLKAGNHLSSAMSEALQEHICKLHTSGAGTATHDSERDQSSKDREDRDGKRTGKRVSGGETRSVRAKRGISFDKDDVDNGQPASKRARPATAKLEDVTSRPSPSSRGESSAWLDAPPLCPDSDSSSWSSSDSEDI